MVPAHPLWSKHTNENRARIPMFERNRSEFLRLQKKHRNLNVLKNKIRIPVSINMATIPMVGRIRSERQRIKKIGPEYQLLEE